MGRVVPESSSRRLVCTKIVFSGKISERSLLSINLFFNPFSTTQSCILCSGIEEMSIEEKYDIIASYHNTSEMVELIPRSQEVTVLVLVNS